MLRWKNIPINELSEQQLRAALIDAVSLNINSQNACRVDTTFQIYLGGILTGGFIAGAGILLSTLIF